MTNFLFLIGQGVDLGGLSWDPAYGVPVEKVGLERGQSLITREAAAAMGGSFR